MKKYILLFLCVSLLSAMLCGCSSVTKEVAQYDTPHYSIRLKDGQYSLTHKDAPYDENSSIALFFPEFMSIAEMRQGIIAGSFTEQELFALSATSQSTTDEIEICDLDHLYECTMPTDLSLKKITWYGKNYSFKCAGEKAQGSVYCYTEEEYTDSFNNGYKEFLSNPNVTLIKQGELEERSATVYYGNTTVAKLKFICYEIRVGNKHLFVQEEYVLEIDNNLLPVSYEIPSTVYIWGTENGGYFYGLFRDFTERPSVEWLSEFGLTPYKG